MMARIRHSPTQRKEKREKREREEREGRKRRKRGEREEREVKRIMVLVVHCLNTEETRNLYEFRNNCTDATLAGTPCFT